MSHFLDAHSIGAYDSHYEETSGSPDKRRLRITRACDFCRRKKVKCHFTPGQACANCLSYGVTCEFNDGAKKRGPPKGYIDALEKRIQSMEDMLLEKTKPEGSSRTSTPATSSPPKAMTNDEVIGSGKKRPQGASSDRVQYLGDMSTLQFFSKKIHLDSSNDEQSIWKGRHIRKFGNQVVLVKNDGEKSSSAPPLLPGLLQQTGIRSWIYSVSGADQHTSDRLMRIYFANVHPVLPVVNKTEFLRQYRDQADTYPPPDLLNAMFGAAARYVECEALQQKSKPFRPPDTVWDVPIGWSDQFFDKSQAVITASDTTLSKVQSIILIHNHSGSLDSKSSACWLLSGLATRLAQGLGLNRNCDEWDIPDSEKQTRNRIWWALYVMDKFHSASLGRPISIRDEDNDVMYPDASASWEEVLDTPGPDEDASQPRFPSAVSRPAATDGRVELYQLFNQLVKLSEILGRILQGLYSAKAQKMSYEHGCDAIVTRLDHELTEWRFAFPKALEKANFGDFDENSGYLAPVIASVLLCYFSLLILLHRPFIEKSTSDKSKARSSYSSFRIGTSAAIRGMRIASQMTIRDVLMFPYSFSLYPVLQCCLILMYNTKNPDARVSGPAKLELGKGMTLVKRLHEMSSTSQKLYSVLNMIMSHLNVDMNASQPDVDEPRRTDSDMDGAKVPHRVSDVGRGISSYHHRGSSSPTNSRTYRTSSRSPVSVTPLMSSLLLQKPMLDPVGELPPSATNAPATSTPSPASAGEAFSLKQFGFTTPDSPSKLDYTMQDLSAFSGLDAIPSMPIYSQYPELSLNSGQSQSTAMDPTSMSSLNMAPATMPSTLPTGPPMYSMSASGSQNDSTLFRNHPDNPFWGIPASMDWTEWNEWSRRSQGAGQWQHIN